MCDFGGGHLPPAARGLNQRQMAVMGEPTAVAVIAAGNRTAVQLVQRDTSKLISSVSRQFLDNGAAVRLQVLCTSCQSGHC